MSHRWLTLRFDAPIMAFGGVAIDQVGPTRQFPTASMLTGLIGNALGWNWSDRGWHQDLQGRLVFAARLDQDGVLVEDNQNAQLARSDKGWTSFGCPEGRAGASYGAPHRRFREYLADASVRVVLRLRAEDQSPRLKELADAFEQPARPLYIGRKPCLPSMPFLEPGQNRWIVAETAWAALCAIPGTPPRFRFRAQWPVGEGPRAGECFGCIIDMPDLRNWHTGLHAGARQIIDGWVRSSETT
ncbi:MAG: type I-E CRISPR-associated protein Cas5/CasD [Rhodobacteraceae bacterium]|nr:type I-E CRISPR-associated protein Cas5/CasD [Paracoccaceae bacterium]